MMRRLLGATAALALAVSPAYANGGGYPPAGASFLGGNGANVALGPAVRAAWTINIGNYGAKCDGFSHPIVPTVFPIGTTLATVQSVYPEATATTNETDGLAISKGADIMRAITPTHGQAAAALKFIANGFCLSDTSINFTNLRQPGFTIDGAGAMIYSTAAGQVAVDELGTQRLRTYNITIIGDATSPPSLGFQLGRTATSTSNSSDDNLVVGVNIQGNFSFAAGLNENAETTHFELCASNSNATGMGWIQDGSNHWNVGSLYAAVTLPVDTVQPFNGDVFVGYDFRTSGTGVPLWLGGTTGHRFLGGYLVTTQGANDLALFETASVHNRMLLVETHTEGNPTTGGANITDAVLITGDGTNTTPEIDSLDFLDQRTEATNSLIKLDTSAPANITAATLTDAHIRIANLAAGNANTFKVFDNSALWTMDGYIHVPASQNLTIPTTFSGIAGTNGAGDSLYIAKSAGGIGCVQGTGKIVSSNNCGTIVGSAGFKVANLPTTGNPSGGRAYVTDQLTSCPDVNTAPTGGGALSCPVFWNGTAWRGG